MSAMFESSNQSLSAFAKRTAKRRDDDIEDEPLDDAVDDDLDDDDDVDFDDDDDLDEDLDDDLDGEDDDLDDDEEDDDDEDDEDLDDEDELDDLEDELVDLDDEYDEVDEEEKPLRPAGKLPARGDDILYEHPDDRLPRAVMFRDSFATWLIPLFSENFSRILFSWQYTFDHDLVERERPDIVIQEMVERALMASPPPSP